MKPEKARTCLFNIVFYESKAKFGIVHDCWYFYGESMVLNLHIEFGEMSCIFCGHNSVISFSFICSIFKYFILD